LEGQSQKNYYEGFFPKKWCDKKNILEDLGLLIVKNNLPINSQKMWLNQLILCSCPKLNVLSKRKFSQEMLLRLMEKIKQLHVFPTLA
jgi:hypothetical protein